MRVTIITDRPKSAISILAADQQRHSPQHDIHITPVHPKRPSSLQLRVAKSDCQWADVIHVAYWRSGEVLNDFEAFQNTPKILVHHNPYDLDKRDWKEYRAIVVKNRTQAAQIENAFHIPHAIDQNTFTWNPTLWDNTVGMVAGRIEGNKGVLPVAKACAELGLTFLLVGRPSSRGYLEQIKGVEGLDLDYREDVSKGELVDAYHEMDVVVVNSKDGFESGPLIVLEAAATGTPVLTRKVGLVKDAYNGKNLMVRDGEPGDVDDIAGHLRVISNNPDMRNRLRLNAFKTITVPRTAERAARKFSLLYHLVGYDTPLVSVIVPTYNRADTLPRVLDALEKQTYPHLEIIICDDNSDDKTKGVYRAYRRRSYHSVKYVNTESGGYGLAKARNMGIVEAEGARVAFVDDRLRLEPDAIEKMVMALDASETRWVWGVKDDTPKSFVENFSATWRDVLTHGAGFNERFDTYGGLTRDTIERYRGSGVRFRRVDAAKAYEVCSSSGWKNRKDGLIQSAIKLDKLYGGV